MSAPPRPSFDPGAAASGDGIFGLSCTADEARVVLVPVPWEPTTSYGRGAARGPAAILAASRQVELYDLQTGRPYQGGIALLDDDPEIVQWNAEACAAAEPIVAAGGAIGDDATLSARLARVNELSAMLDERVARTCEQWLVKDKLVGLVGGDHSAAFGAMQAHTRRWPGLGVLHFDAHADLRPAYEGFTGSHASIMCNVVTRLPEVSRIVQVGLRDLSEQEHDTIRASQGRLVAFYDNDITGRLFDGEPFSQIATDIVESLPEHVYVSFDIDGLDPALCPGTGTPVPGGLSFQQAVAVLARVAQSGRTLIGFDLCEVAPGPAGDEWNANVGARILYKLIGHALLSRTCP